VELARLAARMLAKKPAQRPRNAKELSEALLPFTTDHKLTELLSAEPKESRLLPVPRRPVWKRRPALAALGCALLAALVLGPLWYLMRPPAHSVPPASAQPPALTAPAKQERVLLRPSRTLKQHQGGVMALALSPEGKVLASGSQDRAILLWDTDTWIATSPLTGHSGDVIGLAFSPDGSLLASVTSSPDRCAIRLWEVATGRAVGTLGEPTRGLFAVAYSPDGRTLACGGWDGGLHLWDVATGREQLTIPNVVSRYVRALAFSPDGQQVATGGSGPTRLWNPATGKEVPTQRGLPEGICPSFLPGGTMLVGWDYDQGLVTLCEMPSGRVRATWRAHPELIEGLAVSPDGRFLASLGVEGIARLWTVNKQEVATLVGHSGPVYAAAFTPDGSRLITAGSDDNTIRLWDLPPACRVRK
jgi:WD40 repeat protein